MPRLEKVGYCSTCPAFESGVGRCVPYGPPICDVYVLGGPPSPQITQLNSEAFSDESGMVYKAILNSIKKTNPKYMTLRMKMHHAAHCSDVGMSTEIVHHCASLVTNEIYNSKAKVILALGTEAMKALGIKGTVGDARGQETYVTIGDRDIPVIVSFAPGALVRKENVGKLPTAKHDMQMALNIAAFGKRQHHTIEELTKDYIICKTPAEFKIVVDTALAYPADLPNGTEGPASKNMLAIDTETAVEGNKYSAINTWVPGFKMIALSVSWAKGKSSAVLLDHRLNPHPYSEYEEDIKRLLSSPNPKTFHNWKYDCKVLELAYPYYVNNLMFDSQMGEYLLDENKAGEYGLKKITKNRVPDFYGYEKMLKSAGGTASEIIVQNKEKIAKLSIALKDAKADAKQYREEIKAVNANKKPLSKKKDAEELGDLDKQKARITLTLDDAKARQLEIRTEAKELKEGIATAKDVLAKMKEMSFEDMDVDVMLQYAAIDTDITRQISKQQIAEIKVDSVKLFNVLGRIMLPAARVLAEIEHVGIKVDLEYLEELRVHFDKVIDENKAAVFLKIGREINLNSAKAIIDVLVVDFGVKLTKTTKSGQLSTDSSVMEALAKEHPIAQLILDYKQAYKARNTFLKGIMAGGKSPHDYGCSIDGRIHGNYNQTIAATGRLCVAKGSLVEVVRDVSKFPKGIPIEEVKVGDLAYSYDADRNLVLRPVVWSGKTGHKEVIRVHWGVGKSGKDTGYLDLTPDHKVRLLNGEMRQAGELKPNDRILSMRRRVTDEQYARLRPYGFNCISESRFIHEHSTGETPEHVHHQDHNPLNNVPSNLVGMTEAAHARLHSQDLLSSSPYAKKIKRIAKDHNKKVFISKSDVAYVGDQVVVVSKYKLLKRLARAAGSPTKCQDHGTKDFNTFKRKLKDAGIDWKIVALRYSCTGGRGSGGSGEYLSRRRVQEAINKYQTIGGIIKDLRIGYKKLLRLLEYYNLDVASNNHVVTSIEVLNKKVDVYCLEVEDTHLFVCNELTVANSSSSPNLQNVPQTILGKNIKKMFIPDDAETQVMVQVDASAAEVRVMTAYAPDPELIKVLNAGMDTHSFVGSNVFATKGIFNTPGVTYEQLKNREDLIETDNKEFMRLDTMRQISKMVMFLTIYGGGAFTLQANLAKGGIILTIEECEAIIAMLLKKFPAISTYMRTIKNTVNQKGEVETYFGRKRRFPIARFSFKMKKAAHREAINSPIQGTSSDIILHQMTELHGVFADLGHKRVYRGTVHDSVFFQWPKKDLHTLQVLLDLHFRDNVQKHFKWMRVPFNYDAGFGPSYGEAKINLITADLSQYEDKAV